MPKDDWKTNSVPTLFRGWGAWPWMYNGAAPIMGHPSSILDVACGLSLKLKFIEADVRVGLDLHRPYLEAVESDVPWIPIVGDATELYKRFLPNSFDLVLLLDIVEHVEKDQALDMIRQAEEIAKVAVVIETPKGLLPQDLDILGFDAHHLQTHRCGFEKGELEELGYQVFVRDYQLAPIKRHSTEPIATECQLLNAIKRVDQ